MCAHFTIAKDLAVFAKFFNFVCRVAFFAPRLAPSRPLSRPHGLCRSQILFATSQVAQIKQRPAPASPRHLQASDDCQDYILVIINKTFDSGGT
jgi:hypothetical protein